jgi:integrase
MIITVFTRHSSNCAHLNDRDYKRCNCRKWLYVEGSRKPISAKTRSWAEAQRKAEELRKRREDEQSGKQSDPDQDDPQTVGEAVTLFLQNKATEGHSKNWNHILRRDLTDFAAWCARKPVTLSGIKTLTLEQYRKTWTGSPSYRSQRQDRLSHFFNYCVDHGWMLQNFAAKLSRIKVPDSPTLPLTREEFERAFEAVEGYNLAARDGQWRRQRVRAMLLLLRWSGLRISDAAKLERSKLSADGKLFLRTPKTGQSVYVPLPPSVTKVLRDLPNLENPRYFFWTGTSDVATPGKSWWKTLKRIFRAAGLPDAHPHTMRDTFAVECLVAGVTLEEVSVLLGHSNTKVTEKHYKPWVRARQEQLERSVAKAWDAEEMLSVVSPASSVQ